MWNVYAHPSSYRHAPEVHRAVTLTCLCLHRPQTLKRVHAVNSNVCLQSTQTFALQPVIERSNNEAGKASSRLYGLEFITCAGGGISAETLNVWERCWVEFGGQTLKLLGQQPFFCWLKSTGQMMSLTHNNLQWKSWVLKKIKNNLIKKFFESKIILVGKTCLSE